MFVTMMIAVCVGCGVVAALWNAHDRKAEW